VAQGAARGAISSTLTENEAARDAATPIDHQGTPAPAAEVIEPSMHPYAANDVAAAAIGVEIGHYYRNTAGLQQRMA
jgi:hypothetical protein